MSTNTGNNEKDWTAARIMMEVRERGENLSSLDRRYGFERGKPCYTATLQPHKTGEAAIAEFLGVAAHKIWPSRYDADGKRLEPQPYENYHTHPRFKAAAPARRAA